MSYLLTATLLAAMAQTAETPHVRVTGRATLSVEPERARVDVGVVTEAPEAEAAARGNAEKLDTVLRAIRDALGPEAKLETMSYSLRPQYTRAEPRAEPVISGYTASNVVSVRELELASVGRVIDVATGAGANSVQNIQFSLRDESAAKTEALRQAATEARNKARTLASALGVDVVRILSVSEGEPAVHYPVPMAFETAQRAQAGAPTPVEPGAVQIRASVTLVVEISQ